MSRPDPDARLEKALRELPRIRASAQFASRTVARLGRRRLPARRAATLAWTAAAVALLAAISLFLGRPSPPPEDAAYAQRVEALRREQERLRRDLSALRSMTAEQVPVLFLAGDERLDLVLNLEPAAAPGSPEAARQGDFRPAVSRLPD